MDASGGALPGVTVSITSPNLIGGARTAITDEQGVYRFTLLPGGNTRCRFSLPGFTHAERRGRHCSAPAPPRRSTASSTSATLQESITVTSQSPTIDLESSKVAVNWDQQKLDELPYSRSLTGLVSLIPGLYATSLDVGGSSFGTGSGPAARTFGRAGGGVVSYDGMIWDQTYGDFGTYEEAQITTAAKGADAMNPGCDDEPGRQVGKQHVQGPRLGELSVGRFPEQQHHAGTAGEGLRARASTSSRSCRTTTVKSAGRSCGIACGSTPAIATRRRATSFPASSGLPIASRSSSTPSCRIRPAKITYQITKNNKFEVMAQVGRKWQPYRTASRYVPLESTQNQDSMSLIGPSIKCQSVLSPRVDVRCQPAARRLLVARHAVDDGCAQDRPRDQQRADSRRVPRDRSQAAALAVRRHLRVFRARLGGRNHELKTGYLGWRNMVETENIGYPNQQQYRYRSLTGDVELRRGAQLRRLLHASGLGAGLRLSEHDRVRRVVQLAVPQRQASRCRAS